MGVFAQQIRLWWLKHLALHMEHCWTQLPASWAALDGPRLHPEQADTPPPGPAAPVPASSDLPAPQRQETRKLPAGPNQPVPPERGAPSLLTSLPGSAGSLGAFILRGAGWSWSGSSAAIRSAQVSGAGPTAGRHHPGAGPHSLRRSRGTEVKPLPRASSPRPVLFVSWSEWERLERGK